MEINKSTFFFSDKLKFNIGIFPSKNIRVHYGGSWSESPEVYGKFSAYDYTGGRSIVLDDVSEEGIFLDGWLLSILESIPNPFGYTINLVPDPLFLRNGVRIPVENDSDCLMMMREEEGLDPIPPMVEDEDALIEEEYDILNPNNINIDEIALEEGYQSDESESEGSEGYEPQHEEFEKLTHEIIDEADGELPPVQIEIEEPYVGMEWSTIQKCKTYLRTYAIANRFEFWGKKNDGDRVRLNCKGEECTWMFYARASKSKKKDGYTTRCNKYQGDHDKKCRGDNKLSDCNRFLDDLEKVYKKAVDWLKKRDVTTWCRSHFWTHTKSEHITNNFSESFNQWIMDLRDKPVCTFVEKLNLMLMTLMRKRRIKTMKMDINDVVPRVKAIHKKQIFFIKEYTYISVADHMFTVLGSHGSRWLVNLDAHECECRVWQLTGISCMHDVCIIEQRRLNYASYCNEYLTVRAYVKTYSRVVLPIPNDKEWGKPITQVLPPSLKRQPGRPKKNRRKDADEQTQAGEGQNASQAGEGQNDYEPVAKPKQIRRCSKCHFSSHNIRTCPEQAKLNARTTQGQSATEAP
ncbi:hypothetical protein IFM89_029369 [Coptis chinensis]|uniref:SWIM-type domain-containing protein n=1 Tax=Coptis chinensis TaxID=261450 RepID=A0A835IN83_9MAGN|nr:hypothetical protein IFM89_029369 [Coptis chinensis]